MRACTYKKFFFFSLLLSFKTICGLSQKAPAIDNKAVSLGEQLNAIYNISHLPNYLSNTTVAQISTYDTTGGNNDGFNGTYSFIRKDKDSNLVIFDIKGAGVINRIWTPTPGSDTLDFYIDDTTLPAFSIKYMDLFSNKIFPFINPLCGNELGGYYCYLPIPFQAHCKIVCRARQTQFHQIQYRLYRAGTIVKRFSLDLQDEEKSALKKIASLWNNSAHRIDDFYSNSTNVITSSSTLKLVPGGSGTIFNMRQGGRILGLNFFTNRRELESLQNVIDIKITWDDEHVPAVYCPIADFFGYAFGKASMRSLLLGSKANNNYTYFPMPFDKMAKIELLYRKTTSGDPKPVTIKAVISYTKQKRDISN